MYILSNIDKLKDLIDTKDIKYKEAAGKLSRTERQWLQIEKERDNSFLLLSFSCVKWYIEFWGHAWLLPETYYFLYLYDSFN